LRGAHGVRLQPAPINARRHGGNHRSRQSPPVIAAPPIGTPALVEAPVCMVGPAAHPAPPYTLDSGDKLRIVVFGQDTLSNNYTVDAQGQVSLPLIGAVPARGLTTAQLSASITSRLKQSFIRDPSVAVEIETYRPFFVLGEVAFPGQYPYVPNMTIENAVAIAGGFTPRASKDKVTVTRKVQGVPARYSLPLRVPVRPGDTITVGERWF
jgi:polysaccharide biosynthesis/export protein